MAAKGKYNAEMVQKALDLAKDGASDVAIYRELGINHDTFYEWLKKPDFSEAIKTAREDFRSKIVSKLEQSLWKRAQGYDTEEVTTEFVSDRDGNPHIKSQTKRKKHIPADTGCLIFALNNVAPEAWKNVQRVETKEVKKEDAPVYHFEDIDEKLLFQLADQLQDAQAKREAKDVR